MDGDFLLYNLLMPDSTWKKILFLPLMPAVGLLFFVVTLAGAFLWYQSRPPIPSDVQEVSPAIETEPAKDPGWMGSTGWKEEDQAPVAVDEQTERGRPARAP